MKFEAMFWVIIGASLVILGDWMTVMWARHFSWRWAVGAMIALAAGCAAYFPAIRQDGLARVAAMGSVAAALGGVLVGWLLMGESFTSRQAVGAVLALVAMVLLA